MESNRDEILSRLEHDVYKLRQDVYQDALYDGMTEDQAFEAAELAVASLYLDYQRSQSRPF